MKNLIKFAVLFMLLKTILFFTACQKSELNEMQKEKHLNSSSRVSANQPGQHMDWDGKIEHDCFGVGTKCPVVYPDIAISSGWDNACVTGTLETYIQNNGETFGFSQELLQNLINATSINKKEGNGGYQYRPIN